MKVNKYLRTIGMILLIVGFFSYDLTDYSFEFNKKSWLKIIIGLILLLIPVVHLRIKKEKRLSI